LAVGQPWCADQRGDREAASSGWRPILEAEFDLAYTPLMELDYGKGRLVWCALDLEDYVPTDPAAVLLAQAIVEYAAKAPLVASRLVRGLPW
jgi:hypothetical protein